MNEGEFSIYEQRTQKKLETKSKRKRGRSLCSFIHSSRPPYCEKAYLTVVEITQEEEKTSRKYAKRRDRRQAIISMLDSLSSQHRQENLERNLIYFKNPFELAVG